MDRHTVIPRVLCFVFYKKSVLLLKASQEKDWYGYFEPPGGHIEKAESIIGCAEKEIVEETGLKVKGTILSGIVHVSGFYNKEIMLFVTKSTAKTDKVVGSTEGEPVWIAIDKLNEVKMLEDIRPILQKVIAMEKGKLFIGTSKFDGRDKLISLDITVQ